MIEERVENGRRMLRIAPNVEAVFVKVIVHIDTRHARDLSVQMLKLFVGLVIISPRVQSLLARAASKWAILANSVTIGNTVKNRLAQRTSELRDIAENN